jgi:hypothetical protein
MLGFTLIRKSELRKKEAEIQATKASKEMIETELKSKLRSLNEQNTALLSKVKELTPERDSRGRFTKTKNS